MSEREMVRAGDAAGRWVLRWPDEPTTQTVLVVQAHEQAVFVADHAALGAVGSGRYALDPAAWPEVAQWADPNSDFLHIQVYFVTSGTEWFLDLDAPVGAVAGLGGGRAGYLHATARLGLRVADAVALVRAVLADGGDFTVRHARWIREAGRTLADTAHAMLLQGSLDPARSAAAVFAVGRHALPALRHRLSADGLDALELEHFALVESAALPMTGPSLMGIESSVLAETLAALAPARRLAITPATLRSVVVTAPARVGVLRAGVITPSHDQVGVRHDEGVPVLALDARAFPRWRGAEAGDRTTDALALAAATGLTAEVSLTDGLRGAAWRPGDATLQCAIVTSAMGEPDGVAVVAGMPGGQTFAGELAGSWELPTTNITATVDVSSGWLVLAWARASGRYAAELAAQHGEDAWMAACVEGDYAAAALATGLEAQAGGTVAWLIRVRPGTWRVTHHHGTLGDARAQCLVLSHASSVGWQPAAELREPAPRDSVPEAAQRDREVFPGQPVARLSEYVRMVRGLRADEATRKETLAALGLGFADFGEVMQRWSRAMMEDHGLGREVARAMNAAG